MIKSIMVRFFPPKTQEKERIPSHLLFKGVERPSVVLANMIVTELLTDENFDKNLLKKYNTTRSDGRSDITYTRKGKFELKGYSFYTDEIIITSCYVQGKLIEFDKDIITEGFKKAVALSKERAAIKKKFQNEEDALKAIENWMKLGEEN